MAFVELDVLAVRPFQADRRGVSACPTGQRLVQPPRHGAVAVRGTRVAVEVEVHREVDNEFPDGRRWTAGGEQIVEQERRQLGCDEPASGCGMGPARRRSVPVKLRRNPVASSRSPNPRPRSISVNATNSFCIIERTLFTHSVDEDDRGRDVVVQHRRRLVAARIVARSTTTNVRPMLPFSWC